MADDAELDHGRWGTWGDICPLWPDLCGGIVTVSKAGSTGHVEALDLLASDLACRASQYAWGECALCPGLVMVACEL